MTDTELEIRNCCYHQEIIEFCVKESSCSEDNLARYVLTHVLVCGQAVFRVTFVPAAAQMNWMCDKGGFRLKSSGMLHRLDW
jgi:hypothetical protein